MKVNIMPLPDKEDGIRKGLRTLAGSSTVTFPEIPFGRSDCCGCVDHGGKCDTTLF